MDQDRALYIISVAAELAGVHPQTLRIYERKGLIEPQRTTGRSRRYSDRDIERLQRIQELTSEGMNLAGVQRILELEEELERTQEQVAILRDEVAQLHHQYRRDLVPFSASVIRLSRQ